MSRIIAFSKDPDEDLDYTWDFSELLETGEVIDSYQFVDVPVDIVLHDETQNDTEITAYIGAGGSSGQKHVVTCRIVTDATPPRTFDRSIKIVLVTK